MQKRTKSILEELNDMYVSRDRRHLIESRAANLIETAVNLLEQIDATYTPEQAENLTRKFLNAIRARDVGKFTRSAKRTNENADQ